MTTCPNAPRIVSGMLGVTGATAQSLAVQEPSARSVFGSPTKEMEERYAKAQKMTKEFAPWLLAPRIASLEIGRHGQHVLQPVVWGHAHVLVPSSSTSQTVVPRVPLQKLETVQDMRSLVASLAIAPEIVCGVCGVHGQFARRVVVVATLLEIALSSFQPPMVAVLAMALLMKRRFAVRILAPWIAPGLNGKIGVLAQQLAVVENALASVTSSRHQSMGALSAVALLKRKTFATP